MQLEYQDDARLQGGQEGQEGGGHHAGDQDTRPPPGHHGRTSGRKLTAHSFIIQRALQGLLPVQVWRLHQHRGRRGGAARGEDTWLGPGGPGEVLEGRQHLGTPLGGAGHLQDQERSVGAGLESDLKEVQRCDSHRYLSRLQNKYLFTFSKQILTNPITTKGNDASENSLFFKGTTRPG